MNKLILKTALITLATLILAGLLVFSLWILCAPQTMATSCEKTGNYSFAVTCADLRYKYTKDIKDLARCAEDGIISGKDKHILKYCGMLVEEDGFEELCAEKDKELSDSDYGKDTVSYKSYVLGHLAAAQYRGGDLQNAIKTAENGGEQSLTRLVLSIVGKNDKAAAKDENLLTALDGFDNLKSVLQQII